jgi:hypothetical protein
MVKLDAERMQLMQKLNALDEERAKLNHEYMKKLNDHEWENAAEMNLHYDDLLKLRSESLNDPFFNYPLELDMNTDNILQKQLLNERLNKLHADQLIQNENNEVLLKQLLNENFNTLKVDQLIQNENNQVLQKQLYNDQVLEKQLLNEKMNLLQDYQWEQQQPRTNNAIEPIIEDLLEEKIISTQQELTFELNADKFVVNGKKQPAEVHNRYKEKYLKKNGDYYKYSRKNGSTSTTIHSD